MTEPNEVSKGKPAWPELLGLAFILTIAAHAVPEYALEYSQFFPESVRRTIFNTWGFSNYFDCLCLIFGLILCLTTPRRSGLRIGTLRPHHWNVLVIVAVPIVLTAIIYPRLPVKPFANMSISMWLISPLAQDLIFSGYLYGLFAQRRRSPILHSNPHQPSRPDHRRILRPLASPQPRRDSRRLRTLPTRVRFHRRNLDRHDPRLHRQRLLRHDRPHGRQLHRLENELKKGL